MFTDDKVNVPVLGIVENMAWFTPEAHPTERYYIFGRNGAVELAEKLKVELLAQIPMVCGICEGGDQGSPIALADSMSGLAFMDLAEAVDRATAKRNNELPPTEKVHTHQ